MKNSHILIAALVGLTGSLSIAHAQLRGDDEGPGLKTFAEKTQLRVGLGAGSGGMLGLGYQFNNHIGISADYGSLYYADAANLTVRAGSKHFYAFGTVEVLNINERGRDALLGYANDAMTHALPHHSIYSSVRFNNSDMKFTDYGIGGGVGVKVWLLALDLGVRTNQFSSIGSEKVDLITQKVIDAINSSSAPAAAKAYALSRVPSMVASLNHQENAIYKAFPGDLKVLPVIRLTLNIPLSRTHKKK